MHVPPAHRPRLAKRFWLLLAGLLAGACILSPVEDLPSSRGGNASPPGQDGSGGGVVVDPGDGAGPGAAGAGGEGGLSRMGHAGAGAAGDAP
jgi:hypothetical protein